MSKELKVYLSDDYVGVLTQEITGRLTFKYDQGYLDSNSPSISLSLPKEEKEFKG